MTNQEILEKAIQKAIEGGWEMPEWAQGAKHLAYSKLEVGNEYSLIFNHDFARALWPDESGTYSIHELEEEIEDKRGTVKRVDTWQESIPAWQLHLQQMVIADDPIQYLGAHL